MHDCGSCTLYPLSYFFHMFIHPLSDYTASCSFYHQGQDRNKDQDHPVKFTPPPKHTNMHTAFICQENKLEHKVTLWMKFTH